MTFSAMQDQPQCWPELPFDSWKDTCATLHMWTQIVGKVRLCLTPLVNHWWNVPLYVSARGLTTSRIPWGERCFEMRFDFLAHQLLLECSDGTVKRMALEPKSVAEFYRECMAMLSSAGIDVKIWKMPVERPDPIPFDEDRVHAAYDRERVERFWRILQSVDSVLHEFRSWFIGKVSPVHFFWGSFDLAVTRFSGRRAPQREGADSITQEAYSHEVSSVGFWPGGGNIASPAFYSYAAPEPEGFRKARVEPNAAWFDSQLGEYLLMYDDVRMSPSPTAEILKFCESRLRRRASGTGRCWSVRRMRGESMPDCSHANRITLTTTKTHVCEECVKMGDSWVHLRLCLECGHVGCCDSSKNKHATRHFRKTGHPLIRSIEPGENWVWCYEDQTVAGEIKASGRFAALPAIPGP